ncbi:MAG: hypothetical protein AAF399_28045 [Bacteroidota bacterium]
MSQYLDWREQVEAYVSGELTSEEQAAFAAAMQREPALVEEVQAAKEALALLGLYTQVAYKQQLQAFDTELEAEQQVTSASPAFSWRKNWMAIAAVIIVLISSTYLLMRSRYDNQSLQKGAFSPYQNILSMRGNEAMTAIMKPYEAGNYSVFIEEMNAYLSATPKPEPLANLYLGIAYLAEGKSELAVQILDPLQAVQVVGAQAEWYASLAYLGDEQEQEARELLEQIQARENHPYQADAEALLSKLDAIWR